MQRRGLLRRLLAFLALLAGGALPFGISRLLVPIAVADPSHLRPPGALADMRDFTAACIGCGLCAEVCPPRCIEFYTRSGGGAVNTPYIDPRASACILCGKCMEVCPTDALRVIPRQEIDMGIAKIDRDTCYPWLDRGVCGACVTVCPVGNKAINFEFANIYRPVVRDGCVGCGLCVEICPHPALAIHVRPRVA